ncbi:hypothetical protein MYP_3260 [Sporocytophaga myxococcoides]|uniref:YD repeat-containing protein n=1 Tax=Sporocytophaga myxococcoides TaxID=153721 RepID=A0A098LGC4_9BACT|nr:hypothetical protein [Sporocytophaga myxococcoides]GAL86031.1 hypothetical protein MYP_3260 [Sporocytophaga myxococcoides]
MKSIFFIICFLIQLSPIMANDDRTVTDLYNHKKVAYKTVYTEIKNSSFNLFEPIDLTYPQLREKNGINNINVINRKLQQYCESVIKTDSFKFEFQEHAKLTFINSIKNLERRSHYSIDLHDYYENFLPEINDINFSFSFLFDDLLKLNVEYVYHLGSGKFDENTYSYTKSYYISLKNGKTYLSNSLFDESKISQLENYLKTKANILYKSISLDEKSESQNSEEGYEEERYEEEGYEEEEEGSYVEPEVPESDMPLLLSNLDFQITPLYVSFRIPDDSPYTSNFKGQGVFLYLDINELTPFINLSGPLKAIGYFEKKYTTNRTNANIYKEQHSFWQPMDNYIQDTPFIHGPKGVKSITYFVTHEHNNSKNVSSPRMSSKKIFNTRGLLEKKESYSEGMVYYIINYFYDTNDRLVRQENLNLSSEKSDISDFIYDKKGNLIMHTHKDEYNMITEKVYYYRGDTVFEDCRDKNAPFERRINIYTINKYGKIITSYTWGEESQFFDIYDRDKKMATVNSRYPKLYNTLFCYSTDGRLLTYEYDHDRKLYEFIYSADNKLTKIEHIQGQRVVERSEYSYGENGLPVKITRCEGIYNYYDFNNKNHYILEYEFY